MRPLPQGGRLCICAADRYAYSARRVCRTHKAGDCRVRLIHKAGARRGRRVCRVHKAGGHGCRVCRIHSVLKFCGAKCAETLAFFLLLLYNNMATYDCGSRLMVWRQLPKLIPAGSIPVSRSKKTVQKHGFRTVFAYFSHVFKQLKDCTPNYPQKLLYQKPAFSSRHIGGFCCTSKFGNCFSLIEKKHIKAPAG